MCQLCQPRSILNKLKKNCRITSSLHPWCYFYSLYYSLSKLKYWNYFSGLYYLHYLHTCITFWRLLRTVSFLSITVYFLSINRIMESRDASAFKKVAEKPIAGMGPMTYRRPSARQYCRRCIRRKVRRRILAQTAFVLSWLHFPMFDTRCHKKTLVWFRLPSFIGLF